MVFILICLLISPRMVKIQIPDGLHPDFSPHFPPGWSRFGSNSLKILASIFEPDGTTWYRRIELSWLFSSIALDHNVIHKSAKLQTLPFDVASPTSKIVLAIIRHYCIIHTKGIKAIVCLQSTQSRYGSRRVKISCIRTSAPCFDISSAYLIIEIKIS